MNSGPGRSVSADDVLSLASTFGVQLLEEPHLLPLMRQFMYTPLPPGWSYVRGPGENGGWKYMDDIRGESTTEHPARGYFTRAIAQARQRAGAVISPTSQRAKASGSPSKNDRDKLEMWIDLYDDEGNLYYEDLLSGARKLEAPAFTQLPPAVVSSGIVASVSALPKAPWEAGAHPPPPRLQFRAWFQECSSIRTSLIRRELTITYTVANGQFHVKISGTDKEYTVSHIMGKGQAPLTHLDLHTGAVINVLGKPTTLMQANLVTSEWIDAETRRLKALAEKMCTEMRKYGLNPPGSSTAGVPSATVAFRAYKNPAHGDLRRLGGELEALYRALEDARPQAARAFAKQAAVRSRRSPATQRASLPFSSAQLATAPAAASAGGATKKVTKGAEMSSPTAALLSD